MLEFDPDKVERNVREATTEDLLDRVTAYRTGMEPEAVRIIEAELARRGVDREYIADYEAIECVDVVQRPEGFAYRCSFCDRPAIVRRWGWHRLWGLVPVLPRVLNYCRRHADSAEPEPDEEETPDAE
jgi:tRNA 2-selenouridine synthase SelU